MKHFFIALQFLTILPLKIKEKIKEEDFGKSLAYFPLVGLIIGIALALSLGLFNFFPVLVKGVIVILISTILTGGIHLDGFADTCDGFYGFNPREKILEIMRDSRIGAMGAIGLVCLLLFKFSLLVSIPYVDLWKVLIIMPVFSRWAQALSCYSAHCIRKEGKAKLFMEHVALKEVVAGGLFTFFIFLLLVNFRGVLLFGLTFISILLLIKYVKKKIGGMTGDTLGAISEVAEVLVLLFY